MYKVVIAEDEMFVRLGIKTSADWAKLGMEVVADVENGEQALAAYEELHPDIIITDIRMPVMDGMELIRQVRKTDERTRFIILSCLEDFQIVKEAISMGVSDYVLKLTMTQDDMEKVLEKVKKELSIQDKKDETKGNHRNEKQVQERLLNYLYYRVGMGKELEEYIKAQMDTADKDICVLVMEVDHYGDSKRAFNDAYGDILISAIVNILSELLIGENHILLPEKEGRFILMLEAETASNGGVSERIRTILSKIREILNRYVRSTVSFGISNVTSDLEELYDMYHQCQAALQKKFFLGLNRDYLFSQQNEEVQTVMVRKMKRMIQQMGPDEIKTQYLSESMNSFSEHENPIIIKRFFEHEISLELSHILPKGQKRFLVTERYMNKLNECQTFDEVLEVYKECMQYLSKSVAGQKGLSKPVKDILQYIKEHYRENISLDQIAAMVELSRTYVCGLFKKEVGINITGYLMNYRVERAKELLGSTNLRSYEIAEAVGFMDESYFSRTFKKLTGQSPGAYRKNAVKVGEDA